VSASAANGHDDWPTAEANVLGALLLGAPFAEVARILGAEHFSRPDAVLIYRAIATLATAGVPVDVTTVTTLLTQSGHLQAIGGDAALSALARTTPSAANAAAYAHIVRDGADCRRLQQLARQNDGPELLDGAHQLLSARAALALPPEPEPMDWRALEGRTPPPRQWWIPGWLGPSPTLVAGSGGMGKTVLIQALGTSLAAGIPFLAPDSATDLRVLLWLCEDDSGEIWRVQSELCAHFALPLGALAGKLTIVPRIGEDNTLFAVAYGQPSFTPQFHRLRELVNDLGIDVLATDNNRHTFGGNEADGHQVTRFVNGMSGIVRGRPFANIFLGHTSRAPGSEYAGSAAWENAVRMRWYLGPTLPDQKLDDDDPPNTGVRFLARRKANYSEKDYVRMRFQGRLLLPDAADGRRFDASHNNELAEAIVLKALSRLKDSGISGTDGRTSPDYLPRHIVEKGYAEGHSKKELAAAMNRLIGAGRLKRGVVGQYANRTPRHGLVIP
jgi:AAA domain/DnaB-like helicase N terminal domain